MGHALMKQKRLHLCPFTSLKFEIFIKFTLLYWYYSFFHETINETFIDAGTNFGVIHYKQTIRNSLKPLSLVINIT